MTCKSPTCRLLVVMLMGLLAISVNANETNPKPNVLVIAIDDLRPELHCYGKTHIHSPHIDALAAEGVLFERSYCMVPTCGASRACFMTGLRPSRHRFMSYLTRADEDVPNVVPMHQHFKDNGYRALSLGKIFHHPEDCESGWSAPPWKSKVGNYQTEINRQFGTAKPTGHGSPQRGPAYEAADVDDDQYTDGQLAIRAMEELGRLKEQQQPFFLAVGFVKPHLPFVAPQKYWDLYDRDKIQLPENYRVPKDAPRKALHNWGELRNYHGIPKQGPVSEATARSLIHGYYACVSFADAQVGRVLSELDRLGLADNTIVVLWGDHGWSLGDHTLWCKHCCFDSAMHAPLIVRAPGIPGGTRTPGLTEFIDVYPTLCELSGIEKPSHLEGRSFKPLMLAPQTQWKTAAIGRFQSGDTIRTDRFRYSQYTTEEGKPQAQMLYDHESDPLENTNVSERDESASDVESLRQALHQGMGRDKRTAKD